MRGMRMTESKICAGWSPKAAAPADGVAHPVVRRAPIRDHACGTCAYFRGDVITGTCHRYPHFEARAATDWCGEWTQEEWL